ncbi:MAG: DUF378 domain-containing protein [Phycisphaerae bacterium]|nr:DUF378 domain-containing protein [Phycisphaerae bacterium]
MKTLDVIVGALLIIGGLNWGLVGIFNFNLVNAIFGEMTFLSRLIYVLVGLSAIYDVLMIKAISARWNLHLKRPIHA